MQTSLVSPPFLLNLLGPHVLPLQPVCFPPTQVHPKFLPWSPSVLLSLQTAFNINPCKHMDQDEKMRHLCTHYRHLTNACILFALSSYFCRNTFGVQPSCQALCPISCSPCSSRLSTLHIIPRTIQGKGPDAFQVMACTTPSVHVCFFTAPPGCEV